MESLGQQIVNWKEIYIYFMVMLKEDFKGNAIKEKVFVGHSCSICFLFNFFSWGLLFDSYLFLLLGKLLAGYAIRKKHIPLFIKDTVVLYSMHHRI